MVGNPFENGDTTTTSVNYESSTPFMWQMTYFTMAASGITGTSPPFTFAISKNEVQGSFTLAQSLLGVPSINDNAPLATNRNDADSVAKDLEASFDVATLLAFVTAPRAASLNITMTATSSRWTYDVRVLPVLAIPLLATVLICSVYWKVYDHETVLGYNPLEIARQADRVRVALHEVDETCSTDCEAIRLTSMSGA
jgi:membrane-associated phospholipid phosphatase